MNFSVACRTFRYLVCTCHLMIEKGEAFRCSKEGFVLPPLSRNVRREEVKVFIYSLPISLLYAKAASAAVSCKAYYYTFPLVKFTFADDAKNVLRPSATPLFPSVFVLPGGFWRSPDVHYTCFVVVVWMYFFTLQSI